MDKFTNLQTLALFSNPSKVTAEELEIVDISKKVDALKLMAQRCSWYKLGPKNFKCVQEYIEENFVYVSKEQINSVDYSKITKEQFKTYSGIFFGQFYNKISSDNFKIIVERDLIVDHQWVKVDKNLIAGIDCTKMPYNQKKNVFDNTISRERFSGEQLWQILQGLSSEDDIHAILFITDEQKKYPPLRELYDKMYAIAKK